VKLFIASEGHSETCVSHPRLSKLLGTPSSINVVDAHFITMSNGKIMMVLMKKLAGLQPQIA